MNATNPTKGRATSIPLLIAFGVLGVAAYFAGPTAMAYFFLFQEEAKSRAIYDAISKEEFMAQRQPGGNATSPSAPSVDAVPNAGKPETTLTSVTEEPAKEAPKE